MKTFQIEVPENRFEDAEERLSKFIKKANKLGEHFSYDYTEPYIFEKDNKTYMYRSFNISFSELKIGDWNVIGKIENFNAVVSGEVSTYEKFDPRNKNVLSIVPGNDISEYFHWDCSCEHCGINRARKSLIVLENNLGERKVVGKTCLKDFTGHDVEKIMTWYALLEKMTSYSFNSEDAVILGETILCFVSTFLAAIEQKNLGKFVQDGSQDDIDDISGSNKSTFFHMENHFGHLTYLDLHSPFVLNNLHSIMESLDEMNNKEEKSEFEKKLALFVEYGFIPNNKFRILFGYLKRYYYTNLLIKTVDPKKSEFIGKIGEKVTMNIKIVRVTPFESAYGLTRIISGHIVDSSDRFTWFCSGDYSKFLQYKDGEYIPNKESFSVIATVKQHKDDEKYGKQTIVTRMKEV